MKNLQWIADNIDDYETKGLCVLAYCSANQVKEATGLDHYREAVKKFDLVTAYQKKKNKEVESFAILDDGGSGESSVDNLGRRVDLDDYFSEEDFALLSRFDQQKVKDAIEAMARLRTEAQLSEHANARIQSNKILMDCWKLLDPIPENLEKIKSHLGKDYTQPTKFDAFAVGTAPENVKIYRQHMLMDKANNE